MFRVVIMLPRTVTKSLLKTFDYKKFVNVDEIILGCPSPYKIGKASATATTGIQGFQSIGLCGF